MPFACEIVTRIESRNRALHITESPRRRSDDTHASSMGVARFGRSDTPTRFRAKSSAMLPSLPSLSRLQRSWRLEWLLDPSSGNTLEAIPRVMVLRARRQSECQRRRGPAAGGNGDELVLAVRETALEVGLERLAPRSHEPGPVSLLRMHQEGEPAPVIPIIGSESAGLVQRHESRAGRVGVAR